MNLRTHPVPEHLERRITEQGGLASNGSPLFRVIWAEDRMAVIGGLWKIHDEHGNEVGEIAEERVIPKYGIVGRWLVEAWTPPENYGDEDRWERDTVEYFGGKKIYKLGAFPSHGEYELLKIIETPTKPTKFVPLTGTICDAIVAVAKLNRELPHHIRMAAFHDQQEKRKEKEAQKRADILRSHAPVQWSSQPHIIMPANVTQKGRVVL